MNFWRLLKFEPSLFKRWNIYLRGDGELNIFFVLSKDAEKGCVSIKRRTREEQIKKEQKQHISRTGV